MFGVRIARIFPEHLPLVGGQVPGRRQVGGACRPQGRLAGGGRIAGFAQRQEVHLELAAPVHQVRVPFGGVEFVAGVDVEHAAVVEDAHGRIDRPASARHHAGHLEPSRVSHPIAVGIRVGVRIVRLDRLAFPHETDADVSRVRRRQTRHVADLPPVVAGVARPRLVRLGAGQPRVVGVRIVVILLVAPDAGDIRDQRVIDLGQDGVGRESKLPAVRGGRGGHLVDPGRQHEQHANDRQQAGENHRQDQGRAAGAVSHFGFVVPFRHGRSVSCPSTLCE